MPDLHALLRDAAASPRRPLDGQAVVRAAEGRLRRRRQLTSGIAAVAVIGLLVGVALNLPSQEQAVVLDDPTVAQEGATDGPAEAVVAGSSGRFERVVLDGVEMWSHAEPSDEALAAEIVGVIEHDHDCGVRLRQEDSGVVLPVVWPHGTTLTDADPVTLQLPDGTAATVGQRVSGGGGYDSRTDLSPDGCAGAGETAVFNASMPVTVSAATPMVEASMPPGRPSPRFEELAGRWNLAAGEVDGIPIGFTGGSDPLYIEFLDRGQGPVVDAWWGCNAHSYRLTLSETAVQFTGAGKTEMACGASIATEQTLDDAFRRTMTATIEDDLLVLLGPSVVLRFTAAVADRGQGDTDGAALSDDEPALLDAFVQFARDSSEPAPAPLRWADSVSLHLADGPASATFTPDEATGPVWSIEADLFRAYTGPFDPLALIADTTFPLTFGAGPHSHCASPPVPAPADVQDLRRLWIQPEGTSSCLEWFTVDLFLDDAGAVTAVGMDLWEP